MATPTPNLDDPTDLATYKPKSAKQLADDLVKVSMTAAKDAWNSIKDDVTAHLALIAQITMSTRLKLAEKKIKQADADHTMSLLQLNLNATLTEAETLPYITGQKIFDAVRKIVVAVIMNYTGIPLNL